ncbi:hypothetical protein W02_12600 [Nitrospira sp. KM1]|uniref:glycosyltransferase family 4 protein n=1 Tax=Nitrospira sp. KM1 TaxID=1936990 RepID=UPI0013A7974E|nr:glycosyltransferase family 4 protein [Nitrospira sp. KM1]BCA54120.1 hypothetical protein W02_12600 [Nitrospira sp. KM1]
MKVLVISAAYPPLHAGEATNAFFLCKQLANRNLDVHVLTTRGNIGTGDSGITVHAVMDTWSWSETSRLVAFLRQSAPDAILLMYLGLMYNFHPMVTFIPTIAKRLFPSVPFVTRFENVCLASDPSRGSLLSRGFRKWLVLQLAGKHDVSYSYGTLLRDSDELILLCKQHRQYLQEEKTPIDGKAQLIPPPPNMLMCSLSDTDRHDERKKLGINAEDFVIAFLGYIYPAKGVETLLRAVELLVRKNARAKLLFVGGRFGLDADGKDSYVQRMYDLAGQLGLKDNIIWTGSFKAEDEVGSRYLRTADAGVFTFVQGVQLNNSSFSSMAAHGLPMVATRGPWLDEAFVHKENVLLCEPNDPNALAAVLEELIGDEKLRDRLRIGALKLSSEWFSWDRATDRTIGLLTPRKAMTDADALQPKSI